MPESRLLSRRDLDFLLYEWLDVESLTKRERYADHSRETFDSVLDLSAEIATEKFAPCKVVFVPEIGQAMAAYFDAGLQGRPVTGRTLRATRRDQRAPGRPPDAGGPEVLRRRRSGAGAVLRPAGRRDEVGSRIS